MSPEDAFAFFPYQVELGEARCGFFELRTAASDGLRPEEGKALILAVRPDEGPGHLILKRGLCPAADLAGWWERSEKGRGESRDVQVLLLDERRRPCASWYFFNAKPVHLKASGLVEGEEEMPVEELMLRFDAMNSASLRPSIKDR